jgi:DNA-binding GntR family transcriptional regulator
MNAKRRAYEHIKALILERPLHESGFVTENEVASALGISRTPIREALRSLEAEGLLELVPNKGAFIPPVTDRQIVEVMEVRALAERFCAERAIENGSNVAVELRRLLTEQRRLGSRPEAFIECDWHFHEAIVGGADHELLGGVYRSLRDRQVRTGLRAVLATAGRFELVLKEHEAIVSAFEEADPARTSQAIDAHIQATLQVLIGGRVMA